MIEIIPAIDIIGGKCVRLSQGDYNSRTTYSSSPVEMAAAFAECGVRRVHIVDLDGAKGNGVKNLPVLEEIAGKVDIKIEWGGGIKSSNNLQDVFNAGADYAIIGSLAAKEPETFSRWLEQFGGEKIILGADLRNGKVSVNGWLEDMDIAIEELVEKFIPYGLTQTICTDISKDGMLQGPAQSLYTNLQERYPGVDFTVSGGISSMEDIRKLDALGLRKVIAGKAIYENKITLKEIGEWLQRG